MQFKHSDGKQYVGLLILLVIVLFIFPESDDGAPDLIESALVALVPVMAMVALLERGRWMKIGVLLGVPAVAAIVQESLQLNLVGPLAAKLFPLAFFVFATTVVIFHVITTPRVTRATLMGAVCGYLMLGYTFAVAYTILHTVDPGAFASAREITVGALNYYSFVTLTTLGYGDIVPVHPQARGLAIFQAICGVFYMAVLVSRLVSLYRTNPQGLE